MSQISPPLNYMDKVPVKISEKYKPPPKISLPHHIHQKLNNLDEIFNPNYIDYDFNLERTVLSNFQEWKKVRQLDKENRRERLRKYELNRLREIEEKQKQLLTSVSYPSTDDLSSDEDQQNPTDTTISTEARTVNKVQSLSTNIPFSPTHQNFNTILTPTIVPDNFKNKSNNNNKQNIKSHKINYSDFENDTSSPFDNIELKTINDLDVLAQVLKKHSINSNLSTTETNDSIISCKDSIETNEICLNVTENQMNQCTTTNTDENDKNLNDNFQYNNVTNSVTVDGAFYNPNDNINNIKKNSSIAGGGGCGNILQQIQQSPNNVNNFYLSATSSSSVIPVVAASASVIPTPSEIIARTQNIDFYNFYNNLPNNQNYDNNYLYTTSNYSSPIVNMKNYSNDHQYLNPVVVDNGSLLNQFQQQLQQQQQHDVNLSTYQNLCTLTPPHRNSLNPKYNEENYNLAMNNGYLTNNIASKSKSVPDILKELNDECHDSEMRRNERRRVYHQDLETYEKRCSEIPSSTSIKNSYSDSELSDTFMKLSPSSQILAKNISLMGFPLERVCKIAEKFGNDDKKIVEHLIALSELLDLGFEESKISEALLKFDNNKEKALDFLIS